MADIYDSETDDIVVVAPCAFSADTDNAMTSPTLVSITDNRPADDSLQQVASVPTSAAVQRDAQEAESDSNKNVKSSETSQRKGTRSRPSSALLQAKMNARKQKPPAPQSPPVLITDPLQPARDSQDSVRKGTGVVYDMSMVEHRSLWDPTHPERPERFSSIIERCTALGLLERCQSIPPRYATVPEIMSLHSVDTYKRLEEICTQIDKIEELEEAASRYDAIYFHPTTLQLALLACGSTIDLVQNVVEGKIQNGMAIVRPPGHHAMKDEFCGYCYFNNVAIAAQKILDSDPTKRILIVDFDVHHGQATQQMFYNNSSVLYFSTHRFEHGTFWPNLEESNYNWIGTEDGVGFNCNIPLNVIGLGNGDFLSVWYKVLLPMAYQFEPDLVIVSAGFDAALGCPEGMMSVAPQCYPHLISPLMGLANGKIAVVLEGGYCLKSLAEGAALTLRTLLGDPCPLIAPIAAPNQILVETMLNATTMLKEYWQHFEITKFASDEEFERCFEAGIGHKPLYRFDWTEPKPIRFPTRDSYPVEPEERRLALDRELDRLILTTSLSVAKNRVGLVYDDVMLKHKNVQSPHPECPERISNIFACHVSFGLVERCHRIQARQATPDELRLIHSEDHIRRMKNSASLSSKDLCTLQDRYNSIYLNHNSYESALYAAGSLLSIVDDVMNGVCQSGVAIVRPPGHHAEEEIACGFCLFNNVSLAAKYAIENHGLERILIVDWDVHHGNGIQHMFDSDPRVLYISLHRYDNGTFFPGSSHANYTEVGTGPGEGFNVNIPWNRRGMGDTEYIAAFTNIVLPIAYQYAPQLVLVSAGFDAALGDPLGGCKVSPQGYAHMTHLLSPLANGRLILALEGGYNLTSISYSMSLCTKALFGDPLPPLKLNPNIEGSAVESIRNVLQTQSKYWTVLEPFQKVLPKSCSVRRGTYKEGRPSSATSTQPTEVTELLNKMDISEPETGIELETQNRALDFNANSPVSSPPSTIPDPPTSAGEPSLSVPTPTRTELQRNVGTPGAGNPPPNAVVGGGEMNSAELDGRSEVPAAAVSAAAILEPAAAGSSEPVAAASGAGFEMQGAAGGAALELEGAAGGAPLELEGAAGGAAVELEGAVGGSNRILLGLEISFDDTEMFAVVPLTWCPHLVTVNPVPLEGIDIRAPCEDCRSTEENWVCLSCYTVRCSRYVRQHMLMHAAEAGHRMALSFSDLSVWCFACDNYVHCPELESAKYEVYQKKFGGA